MKTRNCIKAAAALTATLAFASATAGAAEQVCPTRAERAGASSAPSAGGRPMPHVRIERRRCPPAAPVHKRTGCDAAAEAHKPNPPPPEGTEPAFGEVPVAAVVPPSAPYSGTVPPGPPRLPPRGKPGCPTHPAS